MGVGVGVWCARNVWWVYVRACVRACVCVCVCVLEGATTEGHNTGAGRTDTVDLRRPPAQRPCRLRFLPMSSKGAVRRGRAPVAGARVAAVAGGGRARAAAVAVRPRASELASQEAGRECVLLPVPSQ